MATATEIPATAAETTPWLSKISELTKKLPTAYVVHFLLAFFTFSSFFIFGKPFIFSTDSLNADIVLLLMEKRNFWAGVLGCWNPYVLAGAPSFLYSVPVLYKPETWLMFLVPDKYTFMALDIMSFVELFLTGAISYRLFLKEFGDRRWALFSSVAYQLCGFTLWSLLALNPLSLMLFATLCYYLIWTLPERKPYACLLLLFVTQVLLLFSTNTAYALHVFAITAVLFTYRYLSASPNAYRRLHVGLYVGASLLAAVVFMIRFLPLTNELAGTNREEPFHPPPYYDTSCFLLRLFNPDIFGVSLISSSRFFGSMAPVLRHFHIHWAMPQFYGSVTALLVLWALIFGRGSRVAFWSLYVLGLLFLVAFLNPIDTLFRIISPVYHTLSWHVLLPIGFCMLAGHAARGLEKDPGALFRSTKPFVFFMAILASAAIYMISVLIVGYRNYQGDPQLIRNIRLAVLPLCLLGAVLYYFCRRFPTARHVFFLVCGCLLSAAAVGLLILVRSSHLTFLSHLKNLLASFVIVLGVCWYLYFCRKRQPSWSVALPFLVLMVGAVLVMLWPWTDRICESLSPKEDAILALMGIGRFVLVAGVFVVVVRLVARQELCRSLLFPVLLCLLLGELLAANKVDSHMVINPFYKGKDPLSLYDRSTQDTRLMNCDLADFRVNFPNTMLELPIYNELYGPQNEIIDCKHVLYGIRSYGGYYNAVYKRYERLVNQFVPELHIGNGLSATIRDSRFLDLAGVGYEFDVQSREIRSRPRALARFMVFHAYELVPDDGKALARLHDVNFDPLKHLVLDWNPGWESTSDARPAERVPYETVSEDHLRLALSCTKPGILFFGDSFNKDWVAYVNGKRWPVLHGNYAFMAVSLPEGQNEVVLRYKPRSFYLGAILAGLGLVCAMGCGLGLFWFRAVF